MSEMSESLNIINQVIYKINKHKPTVGLSVQPYKYKKSKVVENKFSPHHILKYTHPAFWHEHLLKDNYNSMENLINHFKY